MSIQQQHKNMKVIDLKQVLAQSAKSKTFTQAYHEELTRLRLASEIKRLRTQKKFTQRLVAEKTNMPQSVIARIESGQFNVSVETLDRVARALGKEVRLA